MYSSAVSRVDFSDSKVLINGLLPQLPSNYQNNKKKETETSKYIIKKIITHRQIF